MTANFLDASGALFALPGLSAASNRTMYAYISVGGLR